MQISQKDRDYIKDVVDRTSMVDVLDALGGIALLKQQHLVADRQDPKTDKMWERVFRQLVKCAEKISSYDSR